ncbi:hypothetical protein [Thomasclavelia saccharogumia]|uniref:hypothetical protein n=1 Tax=Thomasclavelia saccharogumia TaxID=341225 RepID=UPI00047E6EBA|nr:hypothetical protein [Thomasclavelia saccharogumia]
MKKVKTFLIVLTTIALLVIVAFMPIMLAEWNDERMLADVVIDKIEDDDSSMVHPSKLSAKEKIALLYDYNYRNQKFFLVSQQQTKSKVEFEKIKESVVKEVNELQDLKILPEFDFNDDQEEYIIEILTYTEMTDPESCVVVMQVEFYDDKCSLSVWFDGNDSTIYRCSYYGENLVDFEATGIFGEDVLLNYGMNYLGLSEKEMMKYCTAIASKKRIDIGIIN